MFQYSSASLVALLLTSLCTNPAEARVNTTMSPIYIDNDEYFMNGSNIGSVAFSDIQAAFKSPNLTDEVTFSGYDWTKPFPGSAISGFKTHLRVAYDVPISGDVVEDATTALTSLTYSIPESMMQSDGTLPKPVDPSWYICRHIFVGTKPKISDKIDSACDFLGSECITDLKSSLTKDWMNVTPEVPCSGLGFDPIPSSCRKIFGFARMDVLGQYTLPTTSEESCS
ncbi:hypothetical protein N7457_008741 [Penicillium paradoxum]|uniref:uncharacterized protein n=1 Tax=Penicillium paradoxum TaxID=176176 RepID=UPI00254832CC|nr:uncharacterized protein N7457_008741 [Penicillium paradoxum]KAJ5773845.1 hypothetical protein N7457_008741 [Penicillium paradoxum]